MKLKQNYRNVHTYGRNKKILNELSKNRKKQYILSHLENAKDVTKEILRLSIIETR